MKNIGVPQKGVESSGVGSLPDRPGEAFVRYIAVDLDGKAFDISASDFQACPLFSGRSQSYGLLRQFIANELGKGKGTGRKPKHIEYMQKHDLVDYCEASEKGHYKWLPKGLLYKNCSWIMLQTLPGSGVPLK